MTKKLSAAAIFVVAIFLFTSNFAALAQISSQDAPSRIYELKKALEQTPNHLEYTEYMMLKSKYPQNSSSEQGYYNDDYYLKPRGPSVLSKEFSGGLNSPENSLFDGVDIITGAKAIDESLQVGSIGSGDAQTTLNQRRIESALELYFNNNNKYPDNLNQLVPTYIGTLPEGFTYSGKGSTYQLKLGSLNEAEQINISEIKQLEIKSHPWETMVKTTPNIPQIFSLVPANYATFYFNDLDKFTQLEQTISSIGKPAQSVYSLNDSIAIKDKIFKRLGIKDVKIMRSFIDEVALAAYDLDAYPNTDYALILKIKSSLLNSFVDEYIAAPKDRHGQVGDFYVIATDKSVFDEIAKLKNTPDASLATKKDLSYALSVQESVYDGFAYFSEDFVKKLTGPAYRINTRRRNTVLSALETLQYTVFAYRNITGSWPKSFKQMVDEGYIKDGKVRNLEDYSIDDRGVVSHKDWGSIYNVTPVGRVAISTVTVDEKNLYDRFREGYESYWREFIDPIAITILVGDQIRFRTIILPLIDKSEYNWIKDIAGGEGIAFDFIKNPDRLPALQFLMKLNVDDAIYAYYKSMGYYSDPEYNECVDNYYIQPQGPAETRPTLKDACKFKEKSREESIKSVKDQVAKAIGWKGKTPVFDFIGDEITFAGGENLMFNIGDLSKLDVYFSTELKDTELTKEFLDNVFTWYESRFSDGESNTTAYGLFKLENNKPVKNNYNGVDYYIVPFGGLTNIYYAFINNRLYLTVSQFALNNIIDGKNGEGEKKTKKAELKWPNNMKRLFEYTGNKMNMGFFADNTKLQPWLKGYIKDQWVSYAGKLHINSVRSYYNEALALARVLPNYDGSISSAAEYYRYAPKQWFDSSFVSKDGKVFLATNNKEYNLADIDAGSYGYFTDYNQANIDKKVKLEDITKNFNIDKSLEEWGKMQDLGIAFNLTNEGLDVKIVFSNTASSKHDSRIGGASEGIKMGYVYAGLVVLLLVAGIGTGLYLTRRKKNVVVGAEGNSMVKNSFSPSSLAASSTQDIPPPPVETKDLNNNFPQ